MIEEKNAHSSGACGEKITEQISAAQRNSLRREAKARIKAVKKQAKAAVADIKCELRTELSAGGKKAMDKACRKENRRRIREAKRAEYAAIPKQYSTAEEIFNSVSHGVGAGLSIAALVLLLVRAAAVVPPPLRVNYTVGCSIFGSALVLLYLMSTLYHALTPYGAKKVFAVFDHSSIYILIAGTYTPYCLASLRGALGWTIFGIIWGLAAAGVVFYAIFGSKMRMLSGITYLLMGWLIVFAAKPMCAVLPARSLIFLLAGGLCYTIGIIFYALKKIKWTHCIWHLFVIAGSIMHFFSVFFSMPPSA
ncbi:MAG: hemolysin III family protein [Bacteroides sp.]|nr:hemolysin III family protein [Prevotella sp.]MCM1470525.1 hemolysin III family protein [Bacteroides sp.]